MAMAMQISLENKYLDNDCYDKYFAIIASCLHSTLCTDYATDELGECCTRVKQRICPWSMIIFSSFKSIMSLFSRIVIVVTLVIREL